VNTENREAVNSLEGLLEEIERAYSKRSHAPKQTHDPPYYIIMYLCITRPLGIPPSNEIPP
jgi:hypothetical protein